MMWSPYCYQLFIFSMFTDWFHFIAEACSCQSSLCRSSVSCGLYVPLDLQSPKKLWDHVVPVSCYNLSSMICSTILNKLCFIMCKVCYVDADETFWHRHEPVKVSMWQSHLMFGISVEARQFFGCSSGRNHTSHPHRGYGHDDIGDLLSVHAVDICCHVTDATENIEKVWTK